MKFDSKTIYAQSSDIKSRTYLEYRRDMKKKAIAELEVKKWLEKLLQKEYQSNKITVEKYGGDKFLWFLRGGGVTQASDYIVKGMSENEIFIELQYANEEMTCYDFKRSKVGIKKKGIPKRIPKDNLKFLYLIQSLPKYAMLSPDWIIKCGTEKVSAAWGSREVYAIKNEDLATQQKEDKELEKIWSTINIKNRLLEFQHQKIEKIKEELSYLLQQIIDEEKIVQIIPKSLESFFRICFILDSIGKIPKNANLWLIYVLHFFNENPTSEELTKIIYSVDFLYSKTSLTQSGLKTFADFLKQVLSNIKNFQQNDGSYKTNKNLSPIEETRNMIFCINLLEDLIQDILYYYPEESQNFGLKPIEKIFENVGSIEKVYEFITSN
ncbi:MAG: hypothetical protein HY919_03720 [Elusimicrobia bacterium]|nr:hypothetical protein [Elusimicrobiota bacterium]